MIRIIQDFGRHLVGGWGERQITKYGCRSSFWTNTERRVRERAPAAPSPPGTSGALTTSPWRPTLWSSAGTRTSEQNQGVSPAGPSKHSDLPTNQDRQDFPGQRTPESLSRGPWTRGVRSDSGTEAVVRPHGGESAPRLHVAAKHSGPFLHLQNGDKATTNLFRGCVVGLTQHLGPTGQEVPSNPGPPHAFTRGLGENATFKSVFFTKTLQAQGPVSVSSVVRMHTKASPL